MIQSYCAGRNDVQLLNRRVIGQQKLFATDQALAAFEALLESEPPKNVHANPKMIV
jgi:hypothetical protein